MSSVFCFFVCVSCFLFLINTNQISQALLTGSSIWSFCVLWHLVDGRFGGYKHACVIVWRFKTVLVYSRPLVDFYSKYFKFRHRGAFYTLLYDKGIAYYESAVLWHACVFVVYYWCYIFVNKIIQHNNNISFYMKMLHMRDATYYMV